MPGTDLHAISSEEGGRELSKGPGMGDSRELLKKWKTPVLSQGKKIENGLNSIIFIPVWSYLWFFFLSQNSTDAKDLLPEATPFVPLPPAYFLEHVRARMEAAPY